MDGLSYRLGALKTQASKKISGCNIKDRGRPTGRPLNSFYNMVDELKFIFYRKYRNFFMKNQEIFSKRLIERYILIRTFYNSFLDKRVAELVYEQRKAFYFFRYISCSGLRGKIAYEFFLDFSRPLDGRCRTVESEFLFRTITNLNSVRMYMFRTDYSHFFHVDLVFFFLVVGFSATGSSI